MHLNSGYRAEALTLARHFVRVFGEFETIVAPSSSCVGTIRALTPSSRGKAATQRWQRQLEASRPPLRALRAARQRLGVSDVGACFRAVA